MTTRRESPHAFNLNLLTRINRELDGTIPLEVFAHEARWNDRLSRVEMHLSASRDVAFSVSGQEFTMAAGETIHTENSHKYSERSGRMLLEAGGWTVDSRMGGRRSFRPQPVRSSPGCAGSVKRKRCAMVSTTAG